ncbi:MAG: diaminopimelate epimerase [Bdellovibrio sp.]|nr:diaminopimelate epimerase [Bdellovibrio sp.]
MKIDTVLLSGAGNTFHIFNSQDESQSLAVSAQKELTKKVCLQNPADGMIFLKKSDATNTYQWQFYNNDGSDAEMCGNATRCVGYYIKNILGDTGEQWYLNTTAGRILIQALSNNMFEVKMTAIQEMESKHGFYCNTGVPHLVLELLHFDEYKTKKEMARGLRMHADFAPAGTNVTFIGLSSTPSKVKAVSFERGVEDFTEACGTGAMAAAFYNLKKQNCAKTEVEMPGGTLMMDVSNPNKPIMVGSATSLGKFSYEA